MGIQGIMRLELSGSGILGFVGLEDQEFRGLGIEGSGGTGWAYLHRVLPPPFSLSASLSLSPPVPLPPFPSFPLSLAPSLYLPLLLPPPIIYRLLLLHDSQA